MKRYDWAEYPGMFECEDGEYVLYEDVQAETGGARGALINEIAYIALTALSPDFIGELLDVSDDELLHLHTQLEVMLGGNAWGRQR